MTSSHSFDSSFFKLKGHSDELSTHPSIILCLAGLCKGAKLKIEAGIDLIY